MASVIKGTEATSAEATGVSENLSLLRQKPFAARKTTTYRKRATAAPSAAGLPENNQSKPQMQQAHQSTPHTHTHSKHPTSLANNNSLVAKTTAAAAAGAPTRASKATTKSSKPHKPRRRVATVAQRRAANIRERRRMFNLNSAFDRLRKKVPAFAYEKRLSRIETLKLAIMYIRFMNDLVVDDEYAEKYKTWTANSPPQEYSYTPPLHLASRGQLIAPSAAAIDGGYLTNAVDTCTYGEHCQLAAHQQSSQLVSSHFPDSQMPPLQLQSQFQQLQPPFSHPHHHTQDQHPFQDHNNNTEQPQHQPGPRYAPQPSSPPPHSHQHQHQQPLQHHQHQNQQHQKQIQGCPSQLFLVSSAEAFRAPTSIASGYIVASNSTEHATLKREAAAQQPLEAHQRRQSASSLMLANDSTYSSPRSASTSSSCSSSSSSLASSSAARSPLASTCARLGCKAQPPAYNGGSSQVAGANLVISRNGTAAAAEMSAAIAAAAAGGYRPIDVGSSLAAADVHMHQANHQNLQVSRASASDVGKSWHELATSRSTRQPLAEAR